MSSKLVSALKSVASTNVVLNNGKEMPVIGLGTYRVKGDGVIHTAIDTAFSAGYRSIDTAQEYGNEVSIGNALKDLLPKHKLSRNDVFITSKLSPQYNGKADQVKALVSQTLHDLQTDYLDLFLIHWPGTFGLESSSQLQVSNRHKLWNALIELYKQGTLKSIGVSNYTAGHLIDLMANTSVVPAVNQVEFHPHFLQPQELIDVCTSNKIALQAYASLGSTSSNPLIRDANLEQIAKLHSVSPAQVLLRWALQENFLIIPKSVTPDRIRQNIALDFELSPEEMSTVRKIPNKQKYCWNPEKIA